MVANSKFHDISPYVDPPMARLAKPELTLYLFSLLFVSRLRQTQTVHTEWVSKQHGSTAQKRSWVFKGLRISSPIGHLGIWKSLSMGLKVRKRNFKFIFIVSYSLAFNAMYYFLRRVMNERICR